MRVQMPFLMCIRIARLAVARGLMKAHGVRKRRLEQIVVARGQAFENIGEIVAFLRSEVLD